MWQWSLTNLITFCNKTTGLVEKGRTVDNICLDYSRNLNTISHKNLIDRLFVYEYENV